MTLIDIFRKNVKYYRFLKDYSQEKLGEKSGISTHYVSDIEQGKYSPTIPTIELLSKALDIEPYKLFMENPKAQELMPRVDMQRRK